MCNCVVTVREVESIPKSKDSIRAFRALGQETRFKILDLVSSKSFSVGELEEQLGSASPLFLSNLRCSVRQAWSGCGGKESILYAVLTILSWKKCVTFLTCFSTGDTCLIYSNVLTDL